MGILCSVTASAHARTESVAVGGQDDRLGRDVADRLSDCQSVQHSHPPSPIRFGLEHGELQPLLYPAAARNL